MSPCEHVSEDLSAIVDGDREIIARHADHLASCDACRDARHDATLLAKRVAEAGSDHVANDGLLDRLMVAIDREPAAAPAPAVVPPAVKK
jgi:predicted anti-sigma-YlaC factor YlaD